MEDVKWFLEKLKNTDAQQRDINDVMLLGGEPSMLPMEYLQRICEEIHNYGWRVSLTTNGRLGAGILALDGYVDYLNQSHYFGLSNPIDKMRHSLEYKYGEFVWAKLITSDTFKTMKDFVDFQHVSQNYDFKFSTLNKGSPFYDRLHPKWVDEELIPELEKQGNMTTIFDTIRGGVWNGSAIKFMHTCTDEVRYPKLWPDGRVSRTWTSRDGTFELLSDMKEELE
jgi:organic radical activating enzyme